MKSETIQPGDIVYAATTISNDGSLPDYPTEAILAEKGSRGVLINIGHYEEFPDTELFLVRFEDAEKNLGPAIGCLADELRREDEHVDT